jgi:hypothetical protein
MIKSTKICMKGKNKLRESNKIEIRGKRSEEDK